MIIRNAIEYGIINQEYYFVNAKGQKISKIEVVDQSDFNEEYTLKKNDQEPSRYKIDVFWKGGGTVEETGAKKYTYTDLYIGTYNEFRKINNNLVDSVATVYLKNCREENVK